MHYRQRRGERLTPRELECLPRMLRGDKLRKIARDLGISRRTAGFHSANVLHKKGVHNRTELILAVLRDRIPGMFRVSNYEFGVKIPTRRVA